MDRWSSMISTVLYVQIVVYMKEIEGRKSEGATKINTLAKGKERYYCRWSVDIGSFEYTGFKLQ